MKMVEPASHIHEDEIIGFQSFEVVVEFNLKILGK